MQRLADGEGRAAHGCAPSSPAFSCGGWAAFDLSNHDSDKPSEKGGPVFE
ncbi:hypothetical protein KPATCC21470_6128 [Kitasatospora purpeofusca]